VGNNNSRNFLDKSIRDKSVKNLILSAVPVGQNFVTSTVTAGAAFEIISPQLNINGAIVRTLTVALNTISGGGAGFDIFADITAPTSGSSNLRMVFNLQNPYSSGPVSGTLPYPLYLYPGQGLWAFSNAPASIGVTWDYLNLQ
jgi:hypothetical protein